MDREPEAMKLREVIARAMKDAFRAEFDRFVNDETDYADIVEAEMGAFKVAYDAALAAIEAAGWAVVPKEPTEHMLRAGAVHAGVPYDDECEREWMRLDYKAMLAAAPKPGGEK